MSVSVKNNIFKRKKTCLGVDAEVPRRPDERHLKKDIFWMFHFFLQKKLFFHLQQIRKYVAGHGVKNAKKTWQQEQQQQ